MSNFVNKLRKKAATWPVDMLLNNNSQLANRLMNESELLVFLYGWFEMGQRARSCPSPEMAALMKGSKPTPLKHWCSVSYLSGFVGRDWPSALRVMLTSPAPGDRPVNDNRDKKAKTRPLEAP